MFNPFKSIISGAKGLADKGKSFFENVDAGMESVGNSFGKFKSNVRGGANIVKDAAIKQYDRSYLGYAADKTAKFQRNFNKTVDTIIHDKDARKKLGGVARDEAAKATLSSTGSIMTGLSRLSANAEKLRDKAGIAKYMMPSLGGFSLSSDITERITGKSILDHATTLGEKGAENFYEKAAFIDQYDAEAVTLDQVKSNPELIPQFYVQSVSQAAPSIAISAVATIVSGGSGAFAAGGLMEGGAQFTDAKANGASDEVADIAGLTNGLASGFLESLGARGIFKNNPLSKKISSNLAGTVVKELTEKAGKMGVVSFLKAAAGEGGTEAAQQIVSNTIAKVLYDNERNILEGALESGVVGALAGGTSNVAGGVVSGSIDISQKANKAYKDASPKEKQGGYVGLGGLEKAGGAKNARTETVESEKTESISGKQVAEQVVEIGSDQGGISDWLADQIKKEDYTKRTISLEEIVENDPDFQQYLEGSKDVREFEGQEFPMQPIISSSGEILDGYNRIHQYIKNGEVEMEVLYGKNKPEAKYQRNQSPQFVELSKKITQLNKQRDRARTEAERTRLEKAIFAAERLRVKYQDTLKHTLRKKGFVTTEEAVANALKIPVFKTLSEKGQTVLREKMNSPEALGSYLSGVISYVKNPHETTLPHETFHAVMDMGLTTEERSDALALAREESGMSTMTDLEAEEWLAQKFGDWYAKRSKRKFSDKLVAIFQKIKRFLTRLEFDMPKLEKLFRKVIDEDMARVVSEFKEVGGITAARKEFNQNPEVFTTQLFKDEALWKKGIQKRVTVESALNRLKKPIMREYAQAKLETEFNDQDSIDMGEFKRSILADLLEVKIIESDTYADYGVENITQNDGYENIESKTYLLNTNFNHKVKGHFNNDFDVVTTKEDLMIREAQNQFYVIRKDFSEETMESGVFQTFKNSEDAQDYIDNFAERRREEAGMLAHYRAFTDFDMTEDGVFNVVEMQSDVFQKGITPLVRDAQQLKATKLFPFQKENKQSKKLLKALYELQKSEDPYAQGDNLIEKYESEFDEAGDRTGYPDFNLDDKHVVQDIIDRIESDVISNDREIKKIEDDPQWENPNLYFDKKQQDKIDKIKRDIDSLENSISLMDSESQAGTIEASQERVDNYKKELQELESEIPEQGSREIALSKQFLSLKNNYEEQIVKHAIRQAAANGNDYVRFATPMTVAYVEGYVSQEGGSGNNTHYDYADMHDGMNVDVLGYDGTVISYDEEGFDAIYTTGRDDINNYSEDVLRDEHERYYDEDFVSFEDHREDEFKSELVEEFTEDELTDEIQEIIDGSSMQDLLDHENVLIGNYSERIKDNWVESHMEEFDVKQDLEDQGHNVIEANGEFYFTFGELHQERFGYTKEVDADNFTLDDIEDSTQRLIAEKYGINDDGKEGVFYKILKKKRSDLELVTDDQGFTWWESEIQPDDRAAVELFQKKNQIQKDEDKLEKIEGELVYDTVAFEIKKESLENNPAKSLMKFANKKTMELPEVTGEIGKGEFKQKGDDIASELGFETSEDARAAFEEYVEKNEVFKETKVEFMENKKRSIKQIRTLKNKIKRLKQGKRIGGIEMRREIEKNQRQALTIINDSDLSLHDRAKFRAAVKNIQTNRDFERLMPDLQARIEKLEQNALVNSLKRRIIRLLKKTKNKNSNGKPVGKYTPEIQEVFDRMYKAAKYTKEGAQERISEIILKSEQTGEVLSADDSFELQVLNMMAGFDNKSPEALFGLMRNIEDMIARGKAARELSAFSKKLEINMKIDMIAESIGDVDMDSTTQLGRDRKKSGLKARIKRSLKTLGDYVALDWDGLMETLDWNADVRNKTLRKLLSVNEAENKYKQLVSDWQADISFAISNIYGTKNTERNIARKIREIAQDVVNLGTFERTNGKNIELIFSRDQLIKKYMEFKDPEIRESYEKGNFYSEEIFAAIEGALEPADIQMAEKMFELYNEQYDNINDVYRRLYGVNLPKNEFYSPIRRKGWKADIESGFGEFLQASNNSTVNGGFLKSRVKNFNEVVDQGAFESMERHMNETNYFVAWAEKARELKQIFSDNKIKDLINEEFGKDFKKRINETVDDFITRGAGGKYVFSLLDAVRSNLTTSTLMLKPSIFIKQLTSNPAVLEVVSVPEYISGVVSYFKNWKKNTEILNNESIVLKERGSNVDRDIRDAASSEEFSRFSKRATLVNTLMLNVKLGDKGAIMPAVWAIRQARLKKGMELSEVIKEYEQFTSSTQQSSDLSKLAGIQRGGSFPKLLTMYMTSPRQYYQKELLAVKSLFQKGGTSKQNLAKVARVIFIYHVMLPFIFQFVSNAGRTDEEAWKDYKRAMLIGSINGVFIIGQFADMIVRSILGQMTFDPSVPILQIVNDTAKALKKVDFNDMDLQDVVNLIKGLENPIEAATGIGIGTVGNIAGGVSDYLKGDRKGGIGNILGWTDYAQTGKGKTARFTPEEKAVKKTYEKLAALKEKGDRAAFDKIMDSLSEDEKAAVKLVRNKIKKEEAKKLKDSKEIRNIYKDLNEFKEAGDREAFDDLYGTLTKEEKTAVKAVRAAAKKKAEKKEDETSSLVLGIRGLFVDPSQTIKAILSDEEIEKVEGNLVKFKRMEFKGEGGSADVKSGMMKEMGLDPDKDSKKYKLEHIVPLTAGGRNDRKNLQIVTTKDHNSFTPVDIALGKAVMNKKMSRRDAAQIARALKASEITVAEAMELIKSFNKDN